MIAQNFKDNLAGYILLLVILVLIIYLIVYSIAEKYFSAKHQKQINVNECAPDRSQDEPDYIDSRARLPVTYKHEWHSEEKSHHRIERVYWRVTSFLTLVLAIGALASGFFTSLHGCLGNSQRIP